MTYTLNPTTTDLGCAEGSSCKRVLMHLFFSKKIQLLYINISQNKLSENECSCTKKHKWKLHHYKNGWKRVLCTCKQKLIMKFLHLHLPAFSSSLHLSPALSLYTYRCICIYSRARALSLSLTHSMSVSASRARSLALSVSGSSSSSRA